MTLGEFKDYIYSHPSGTTFEYGISEPFSWRGSYSHVAFSVLDIEMTREEILRRIESALSDTFEAYKGGEYQFDENTEVHFERGRGEWTDGRYVAEWISKFRNETIKLTREEELVELLFNDDGDVKRPPWYR